MSAIKGTLKNKTSLGTIDMYPKTSIDQVENLQTTINEKGVHYVVGTSSQAGSGTSGQYLSTKWEAAITGITAPFDGMQITYRIKTNTGVGTAGAVLSLNGTSGEYHPVVFNVNSVISSRYGVNSTVILTYNSTASAAAYLTKNTKTTITGVWQAMDYDANSDTKLRTYKQNGATNIDLPLLAGSTGTTTPAWVEPTAGSYKDLYGQVANDNTLTPKVNLSTGDVKAKNFVENGTALSAKYSAIADIKDNVTSTDTNKPLSANQGKVLNEKIEEVIVDAEILTSSHVITALGYTPYNSSNPAGYVTISVSNLANYYTKTEIDNMIGEINDVLDEINGEVI